MDEREFLSLADATMSRLEEVIESALDAADVDYDSELQPGGILELTFEDDSKIIINRHAAAREIWVAARAGGFHYRHDGGRWIGTRDGEELFAALSRYISAQAGAPISLQD
ncbi:iron donor protein CyaY [Uliginosibacterium sp. H1]|uniref:iron donor protein CyaY n=1 Tax=Uliginosibacterium sp. H1 TaxID=3114757 RepID=UPI002E18B101|nr:iron donor protein CyaY [Uliginosibacterium sp. H1]